MNDELTDLDGDDTPQRIREQQVWERLQNEAIAAQRWRLEQEIKQAGNSSADPVIMRLMPEKQSQVNRLTTFAVVSFVVITLLGTLAYALS